MITEVLRTVARKGRSAGRRAGLYRLLGRVAAFALVAALVIFHAQLLWQRVASLSLLEPLVAVKWLAAVLVGGAFISLQRAGVSVVRGHKALVLWLLVLMLHAGLVPSTDGHLQPLAEPVLLAVSLSGLALWLRLRVDDQRRGIVASRPTRFFGFDEPIAVPSAPGFFEPLSPRPPPRRS